MRKSMVDIAYETLDKKGKELTFQDIWKKVCKVLDFTEVQMEENIAQLFSDLSLDDRFINIEGKKWDLRKRHKLNERKITTEDFDEDEEDIFEEEEELDILAGEDNYD